MNVGDIVTIKWPGDIIAIRVPEGVKPGDKVRVKLGELLEIVEQPPDMEIEQIEPVSAVAVSETVPTKPSPQGGRPHAGKCDKCGGAIVWQWSSRKNKWYACNTWDRRDFHTREICAQNQQQPRAVAP
jgi:hypothetical protein